jgi:hypothetical protein
MGSMKNDLARADEVKRLGDHPVVARLRWALERLRWLPVTMTVIC